MEMHAQIACQLQAEEQARSQQTKMVTLNPIILITVNRDRYNSQTGNIQVYGISPNSQMGSKMFFQSKVDYLMLKNEDNLLKEK